MYVLLTTLTSLWRTLLESIYTTLFADFAAAAVRLQTDKVNSVQKTLYI